MLQDLKYLLGDDTNEVFLAVVTGVDQAEPDNLLVALKAIPEGHELVAPVAWSGFMDLPQVKDIAVVALAGRSVDYPVVLAVFPRTGGLLIPPRAIAGDKVLSSRPGKKLNISSDTRINIGRGGEVSAEETEPLVLGLVMKTFMTTVLQKVELLAGEVKKLADLNKGLVEDLKTGPICIPGTGTGATATGMAALTLVPKLTSASTAIDAVATAANTAKSDLATARGDYLNDNTKNILSQIAFTHRGAP